MPIGLPSQSPEPKSACTWSSSPIERTIASERAATGRWSTRWFVGSDAPNSGQPAIAAAVTAAGSTPGSDSASLREIRRVDQTVAEREDHRLDFGGHTRAVEPLERAGDDVHPAVELEVEAGGDVVGHGDLTPGVAGAAAQQHPPVRVGDRLPVDRVHEVPSTHRARHEVLIRVGALSLVSQPIEHDLSPSIRQPHGGLNLDTTSHGVWQALRLTRL